MEICRELASDSDRSDPSSAARSLRGLEVVAAIGLSALVACKRSEPADARSDTTAPRSSEPPAHNASSSARTGAQAPERDPAEAVALRERLVREIAAEPPWKGSPGWDPRVLDAVRKVPRHLFVPHVSLRLAYEDKPLPIGFDQTISQPTVVAVMTDALDLEGDERVLEIGTGSGYQAAVLSLLAKEVFTIEIVAELGERARDRLAEFGHHDVHVKIGDGYAGWPEHAPFSRILLTAAPPKVPEALLEQLADGGILVAPIGEQGSVQRLLRLKKRGSRIDEEDLGAVRFVPMVEETRR